MKNRLIVDIYWCALSATWCCKTFAIIHAQNPPHLPGSATAKKTVMRPRPKTTRPRPE